MRLRAVFLCVLLAVSLAGPATAPAVGQSSDGGTYVGTHVQFDEGTDAVSGYAVGDAVLVERLAVQSAGEARSQVGVDVGLRGTTNLDGAAIETRQEARANVSLGFASGGEMAVHDTSRGVVQLHANDGDQVVTAELAAESRATSENDRRVVVTREDGTEGIFLVVGDGEVVVNDDGGVTAEVEDGSQLVYRQYESERSDDDEDAERMIESGVATVEVYVQTATADDADGDERPETVVQPVEYGQNVTVEALSESRETVELAVERTDETGTVVLTSVDEAAFENAESVEVSLDGEAVAQADSMGEVEGSATDGDEPRYYLSQSTSTEATTDVAVGIDGFSERHLELVAGDPGDDHLDGITADGDGFGALAALVALLTAVVARRRC